MVNLQFVEEDHVQIYSDHRPDVSQEIAEESVSFLKEKFDGELETAVDIGCGSGQSTGILAPYSRHVYGLDASKAQIREARRNRNHSNIHYIVHRAERLPFKACSVQLVTACASMHWFDLKMFFSEVRRILVPGGVLVAYTYHSLRPFVDCPLNVKEVNSIYDQLFAELKPCWPKEVTSSLEKYEKVRFPFEECRRLHDIRQFINGRLSDLIGFVESYSAFQIMKKTDKNKADTVINRFERRLRDLLAVPGKQDFSMKLYRDFYCFMCRKE